MMHTYLLQHRKKILLYACFAAFACVLLLVPHAAHAADPSTADQTIASAMSALQRNFNMLLGFMSSLLWPLIYLIGGLFDNQLIFGGPMGEALRSIWIQMRNLTNVIFVLILLVIAIYNVLGLGESGPLQSMSLKSVLPKFVTGLILVNFSFLGAKVFLNFTGVLTQAVFSLPQNLAATPYDPQKAETMVCGKDRPFNDLFCNSSYKYNNKAREFFQNLDQRNIAVAMALNFGKLSEQKFVGTDVKDIAQLLFNIIFGLVMYGIYLVAFLSLFIVLVGRIAVMWVFIALSPFMVLTYVIPELKSAAGDSGDLGQKFLKHASAPLVIGLFMSVGYIMMDVLNNTPSVANGFFSSIPLDKIDPNAVVSGIFNLQQFLVACTVAVVVWTGIKAATANTVTSFITDKITGYASDFGTWAANLPTLLPIVPSGKGFTTMYSLQNKLDPSVWLQKERAQALKDGGDISNDEAEAIANFNLKDTGPTYRHMAEHPELFDKNAEIQENLKKAMLQDGTFSDADKDIVNKAKTSELVAIIMDEKSGAPPALRKEFKNKYKNSTEVMAKIKENLAKADASEEEKDDKKPVAGAKTPAAKKDYGKENAKIAEDLRTASNTPGVDHHGLSDAVVKQFTDLNPNVKAAFSFQDDKHSTFDEPYVTKNITALHDIQTALTNPTATDAASKAMSAITNLDATNMKVIQIMYDSIPDKHDAIKGNPALVKALTDVQVVVAKN